ncbi:unnamed protein product [Cuscuta europaea]|uniref:Zinc knuckle CX2CX4HX4C domain-containing protein n=1 Tax=Cuscuta europaea TaxID=41803 RepID=A0A9P0YSZ0_CUSEU|nr:unnamed protein product [Cuscuta europaea]
MNLGTTRRIGNLIGKFISYDENQFHEKWEAYLRGRVCMDVGKPLKKEHLLRKEKLVTGHWVDFKYEKLPNFFLICGIIVHSDKFCPLTYEDNLTPEKYYGVNLRVGGGGKTSPTGGISG